MKAALFAALQRSPWLIVAVLSTLVVALWLVTSRSYRLSVLAGSTHVELEPSGVPPFPPECAHQLPGTVPDACKRAAEEK